VSISTRLRSWFTPDAQRRAVQAEQRGDLEGASTGYMEAGRYADAVRVMLIRAQGELDPHRRALLLVQATALAPPGDEARALAWRARTQFVLDRAEAGGLDPAIRRRELLEAAQVLRSIGEHELAARALHVAGDLEGEISALADAGAVQRLEEAVSRQRKIEEHRLKRSLRFEEARDAIALGERRKAEQLLNAALRDEDAEDLRALLSGLLARRPNVPPTVQLEGRILEIVPGNPVTLGRSDGELRVASPVVSRRHLEIARPEGAEPIVRDLGGKNGTTLRGARVDELRVGLGLDLLIGNALPLKVRPFPAGGLLLELPGRICWLPLGGFQLGPRRAMVESRDGWVDLRFDRPVVLGDLQVDKPIQLLIGDEIYDGHDGPLLMRVIPPPQAETR